MIECEGIYSLSTTLPLVEFVNIRHCGQYGILYQSIYALEKPIYIKDTTIIDSSYGIALLYSGRYEAFLQRLYINGTQSGSGANINGNTNLTVTDCTFEGSQYGIQVYASGNMIFKDLVFLKQTTNALYMDGSNFDSILVERCTVSNNAGGIHINYQGTKAIPITISECQFRGNTNRHTLYVQAVNMIGGKVTIHRCLFQVCSLHCEMLTFH
jgi:hypothetical protein